MDARGIYGKSHKINKAYAIDVLKNRVYPTREVPQVKLSCLLLHHAYVKEQVSDQLGWKTYLRKQLTFTHT